MSYRPEVTGILLRCAVIVVMHGVTRPATVGQIVAAIERLGVEGSATTDMWAPRSRDRRTTEHDGR